MEGAEDPEVDITAAAHWQQHWWYQPAWTRICMTLTTRTPILEMLQFNVGPAVLVNQTFKRSYLTSQTKTYTSSLLTPKSGIVKKKKDIYPANIC